MPPGPQHFLGAVVGGRTRTPATSDPSGWRPNSKDVTAPRPRPPPRAAQNSSGSSSRLTVRTVPSAVTIPSERTLSQLRPNVRITKPKPPPSVRPAIPLAEISPPGAARARNWVSRSNSPQVTPAWARAVRAAGSTCTPFMCDRSITSPSSHTPLPATWCPPPRMLTGGRCLRAARTVSTTSAVPEHWAMSAGRRSISPFHTARPRRSRDALGRSPHPGARSEARPSTPAAQRLRGRPPTGPASASPSRGALLAAAVASHAGPEGSDPHAGPTPPRRAPATAGSGRRTGRTAASWTAAAG